MIFSQTKLLSLNSHRKELPITEHLAKPILNAMLQEALHHKPHKTAAHPFPPTQICLTQPSFYRQHKPRLSSHPAEIPSPSPAPFQIKRRFNLSRLCDEIMAISVRWKRWQAMGKACPESSTSFWVIFMRLPYKITQ